MNCKCLFYKEIASSEFDNLRILGLFYTPTIEPTQTIEFKKKNRPKTDGIFIGTSGRT